MLTNKLVSSSHFTRNVNPMISKATRVKLEYKSFSINGSAEHDMRVLLPVVVRQCTCRYLLTNPELFDSITLCEVESANQRNTGNFIAYSESGVIKDLCLSAITKHS